MLIFAISRGVMMTKEVSERERLAREGRNGSIFFFETKKMFFPTSARISPEQVRYANPRAR